MSIRGVVAGVLALIALQVITSRGGSKNVTGLFGTAGSMVKRALDPSVPAIPDLRKGVTKPSSSSGGATVVPASNHAGSLGIV